MNRRDLLLTYDFPPLGGGISRLMEEIARGYPAGELLVSTGSVDDQHEITPPLPNPVERLSLPSSRLKTVQGMLLWSRRVAALGRDRSARFAWCGNIRPAAIPAKWAWERTGLPYGILLYGGDILQLRVKLSHSPIKRRTWRRVLQDAAVFVAISRWTADRFEELLADLRLDDLRHKIRIVPLGTDPDRFAPAPEAAADFRARRGLPDGRWLVTVARLVPHKGIDTAIEVVARLAAEHPDLHYAVVGRGTHEGALRALAADRGVADRLHLLTDVADAELPAAYALGDIYLGLSREAGLDAEGFGISLLEAAATGLPVVAGASGGIADAVAAGETGLLVDPLDVHGAADTVRHLLADPALAQGLGAAGRARVQQRFTWARVVSDLRAIAAELGRA